MRNGGEWTEARFKSFIRGGLRSISMRWPPKNKVYLASRRARGVYECNGYAGREAHEVPVSLPPLVGNKRRINNVLVDHIHPVVDPRSGWVDWNTFIDRLFLEADGYQVLCKECHDLKTKHEREARK